MVGEPSKPAAAATARAWHAVCRELLGLVAALAVLAGMLWLIDHVGSSGP
jgi:hypothetical protein